MRKIFKITALSCLLSATLSGQVQAQEDALPKSMVWSAYDLGSTGYAEAAAISAAIQKNFDTRVRVIPSGTSVGRLLPLRTQKADFGFVSNEVYFASEGIHEFSTPDWGPQDVRVVMGRPAAVGMIAAGDVGAQSVSDLRAKRVGYVRGNPSLNIKTDAYLAFGGLTRSDVDVSWYGSYSALKDALIANQIDAMGMASTSSIAREVESSQRGMTWLPFPPDDKKGWAATKRILDFAEPMRQTAGAGIDPDSPVWMLGYRFPVLATYASVPADEVYSLVKAMDESYEDYKGATAAAEKWAVEQAIIPPADAPWHEGAIRYAKEKGYWTEEAQQWQEKRLARLEKVKESWKKARDEFETKNTDDDDWPEFWEAYREKNL